MANIDVVSTLNLTFSSKTGNLVGEASTLDTAIRKGTDLRVVSHLTGNVIEFRLAETHRDAEGDLTHWTFKPIAPKSAAIVKGLVIFND